MYCINLLKTNKDKDMKTLSTTLIALIFMMLSLAPLANGADLETIRKVGSNTNSVLIKDFSEALYTRNHMSMRTIVEKNQAKVSKEADRVLKVALAPGVSSEKQEAMFYILERLATEHKKITGDDSELVNVKKKIFESKLSPAVKEKKAGPVHIVENTVTESTQKSLAPNNIIIKSGETIRWTNNNTAATQRLASVMSTKEKKEILSPKIEPGESWEHTFYTPGEYYYISFPNKVLYGKVVVTN